MRLWAVSKWTDVSLSGLLLEVVCGKAVPLPPNLFLPHMDWILERTVEKGQLGCCLGHELFTDLDYAHDVALLSKMLEVLCCCSSRSWTEYFRNQLSTADCKRRWTTVIKLLHSTSNSKSYSDSDSQSLCNNFSTYFVNKIVDFNLLFTCSTLSSFATFQPDDVLKVINIY